MRSSFFPPIYSLCCVLRFLEEKSNKVEHSHTLAACTFHWIVKCFHTQMMLLFFLSLFLFQTHLVCVMYAMSLRKKKSKLTLRDESKQRRYENTKCASENKIDTQIQCEPSNEGMANDKTHTYTHTHVCGTLTHLLMMSDWNFFETNSTTTAQNAPSTMTKYYGFPFTLYIASTRI